MQAHLTIFGTCSNSSPCKHSGSITYFEKKESIYLSAPNLNALIKEIGKENVTLKKIEFSHFESVYFESSYSGKELLQNIFGKAIYTETT